MSAYPVESSERERARLARQARALRPFTERLLRDAGAHTGSAVLDLGTGAGDVALLAAELVGPTGRVVSMDRDPDNLAHARKRAADAGAKHVTFIEGDIAAPPGEPPFDIAIGRYVLMYQSDPATTVRGVARAIKPGGAVAFHELNLFEGVLCDSWPAMPADVRDMLMRMTAGVVRNVRPRMGAALPAVFAEAGLDISGWHFEGAAEVLAREDGVEQLRGIWTMWSRATIAAGLVHAGEIEPKLFDRWLDSMPPHAAVVTPTSVLGWARKPA